jgi:hypothetical protein
MLAKAIVQTYISSMASVDHCGDCVVHTLRGAHHQMEQYTRRPYVAIDGTAYPFHHRRGEFRSYRTEDLPRSHQEGMD